MTPKITDAYYRFPDQQLSVSEYVKLLSDDFLKEVSASYGADSLSRSDLKDILSMVTQAEKIFVEDIKNEARYMELLVEDYLTTKKIDPKEISYVIYTKGSLVNRCGCNIPYYIQNKFGFTNATVFSLEQECSASLLAVQMLTILLQQKGEGKGIILTSNFFPTPESRLMGLFVVSDAMGLIEVSCEEHGLEAICFNSTSNGSITNAMDFTNKAEEVVQIGSGLIQQTLKKEGMNADDIDLIIPQNTNQSGWNAYFDILGINEDKLFNDNFGTLGHWGDVDFARNITDIRKSGSFGGLDSVFLAYALGTGTSFNVLLLKNK